MKKLLRLSFAGLIFAAGFGGTVWLGLTVAERAGLDLSLPFVTREPGGAFLLTDHTGMPFTQNGLKGQLTLVYLGYTFCPDICPTHLVDTMQALDRLGPLGAKIRPIFISIDPERDTVAQLKGYVAHFSDTMIGLTGTPEQVAQAAKVFGASYRKVDAKSGDSYQMDHSALSYLMGRDGKFLTTVPPNIGPDAMAEKIRKALKAAGET